MYFYNKKLIFKISFFFKINFLNKNCIKGLFWVRAILIRFILIRVILSKVILSLSKFIIKYKKYKFIVINTL